MFGSFVSRWITVRPSPRFAASTNGDGTYLATGALAGEEPRCERGGDRDAAERAVDRAFSAAGEGAKPPPGVIAGGGEREGEKAALALRAPGVVVWP